MVKTRTRLKVKIISATKFITTHCQFDGINHWPGVINGDEVSKSRISPFIAETISKHPKLDVHLVHTRISSNSSGENKMKSNVQWVPHLHSFHYHGFWLMFVQVGDFCASRGLTTVPLTRILCNTVFSKSQNARVAGTLCSYLVY